MAYEASGMGNQEYRHNANRKTRSKEVMRNWIRGSDRQTSGLSSRSMTVRCSPFARIIVTLNPIKLGLRVPTVGNTADSRRPRPSKEVQMSAEVHLHDP